MPAGKTYVDTGAAEGIPVIITLFIVGFLTIGWGVTWFMNSDLMEDDEQHQPEIIFEEPKPKVEEASAEPVVEQRGVITRETRKDNSLRFGSYRLTRYQQRILDLAYEIGAMSGYPETIQAIVMQETLAGAWGNGIGDVDDPNGEPSFGLMQIKVPTARDVLRRHPELSLRYFNNLEPRVRASAIQDRLLNDHYFNILVGTVHFEFLITQPNYNWDKALVAYNMGLTGSRRVQYPELFPYVQELSYKLERIVKPYNEHRFKHEEENRWARY